MKTLAELDLQEAAEEAAGNWRRFDCFVWDRKQELEQPNDWALIYNHHRDSGLLDQSNASVIHKALKPFGERNDPDVVFEEHSHWLVGWISGFSLRVFQHGRITPAFRTYHELAIQLGEYPVLDEGDYSDREFQATLQNINEAAWQLKRNYALPDCWASDVYFWLSDHRPCALENRDDQGGWPDEKDLEAAFQALHYPRLQIA